MRIHKATDARWTVRFLVINHISADVNYKLIRRCAVSSAEIHGSNVFEELLDPKNTSADV